MEIKYDWTKYKKYLKEKDYDGCRRELTKFYSKCSKSIVLKALKEKNAAQRGEALLRAFKKSEAPSNQEIKPYLAKELKKDLPQEQKEAVEIIASCAKSYIDSDQFIFDAFKTIGTDIFSMIPNPIIKKIIEWQSILRFSKNIDETKQAKEKLKKLGSFLTFEGSGRRKEIDDLLITLQYEEAKGKFKDWKKNYRDPSSFFFNNPELGKHLDNYYKTLEPRFTPSDLALNYVSKKFGYAESTVQKKITSHRNIMRKFVKKYS